MPSADPGAPALRPADVERWLSDLGLEPVDRGERDGIASWDLVLDGRRRFDLRVTIILDPTLALICLGPSSPPADQRHVSQVVSPSCCAGTTSCRFAKFSPSATMSDRC
jgi:hypothetical protein